MPEDDEDSEGNINLEELYVLMDSSDLESNASIDSIARNGDFIAFGY